MANKDKQGRLIIPKEVWDLANFSEISETLGFFTGQSGKVTITTFPIAELEKLEFLALCRFDVKHRFIIPKNVEACLGYGISYYFTFSTKNCINIYRSS